MADGALTLILDDETLARLTREAAAAGVTVETYAADKLRSPATPGISEAAAEAWGHDDRARWRLEESRKALDHYDRTGEAISLDEWAADFKHDVKARLAKRR